MSSVNLITVLQIYLVLGFIASIERRARYYFSLLGFLSCFPGRWPKLLDLAHRHRTIFLTWPTLAPVALTFFLMLAHTLAYNLIWPTAKVTPADLMKHWTALVSVAGFGLVMLVLDLDAIFRVGDLDRAYLEKELDRAEYWLASWAAPAVKLFTFGRINPRQMVNDEAQKALVSISQELNKMMWRWALQIAVRLGFGISLWLTWALVA